MRTIDKSVVIPNCIEIHKTGFGGDNGQLHIDIPDDCDLVILASNKGGGIAPYRCLLPHQVYVNDLIKFFLKNPDHKVIYAIPVKTGSVQPIAAKDEASAKYWFENMLQKGISKVMFKSNIKNDEIKELEPIYRYGDEIPIRTT